MWCVRLCGVFLACVRFCGVLLASVCGLCALQCPCLHNMHALCVTVCDSV